VHSIASNEYYSAARGIETNERLAVCRKSSFVSMQIAIENEIIRRIESVLLQAYIASSPHSFVVLEAKPSLS
jgi:hypothetical protein